MKSPTIAVVNRSTLLSDADVARAVLDWQWSVDNELSPAWDVTAEVVHVPPGEPIPPGVWLAEFVDVLPAGNDGALAFHDVVDVDVPHMICGVKTCRDNGEDPLASMDHEIKEALVDPRANRLVQVGDQIAWLEVCDPSQKQYPGPNGTLLAEFVLEDFFLPGSKGPFSNRGNVCAPMTITDSGYMMVALVGGQFHQAAGAACVPHRRLADGREPHPASRFARRLARTRVA